MLAAIPVTTTLIGELKQRQGQAQDAEKEVMRRAQSAQEQKALLRELRDKKQRLGESEIRDQKRL